MNASKGKILGKPLDGEYVAYDLEKSPVVTGYFKQGLKSGTWLYHQKGQLSQSTEFLKGVREGENILYADNKMVSKEIYRNDALVEIVDFEDEVMMFTKRFKNGKAEGKWERNLGDSIEVTTYRQGVPIDTVFKSKSTLIPFIKLN